MEKKTAHASEQERPDVKRRREDWFDGQLDLCPDRLVFIDETWTSTNRARTRGRAPKGERLRASVPHGHWKTTTFIAGLRRTGMVAPMVLDGPINGVWFQAMSIRFSFPRFRPATLSSWTISAAISARHSRSNRGRKRDAALSATLQPGFQSNRKGLLEAQGAPSQGVGTNRRRIMEHKRRAHSGLQAKRMHQFLRRRRLRCSMIGKR